MSIYNQHGVGDKVYFLYNGGLACGIVAGIDATVRAVPQDDATKPVEIATYITYKVTVGSNRKSQRLLSENFSEGALFHSPHELFGHLIAGMEKNFPRMAEETEPVRFQPSSTNRKP